MGKIIVSMTSYRKRIHNVGFAIWLLLNTQTRKPDEIHLWLAKSEFENGLNDLPEDLQLMVNASLFILHWVEQNTYVHKRHEIFKISNPDDCVFLIDDDVMYTPELIENVMRVHDKYPNTIVCYNNYALHQYTGYHILYNNSNLGYGPHVNKVRWCGQSMIPVSVYPRFILDDEHQATRNKTSPVSDECWMQPWIVLMDIPIYFMHYGWGEDLDTNNGKSSGLVSWSHDKNASGYERRDVWLHSVLDAYPEIKDKYKRLYNYG